MLLVVGATGPVGLGGEVCRRLRAAGRPVRAIARPSADPARVQQLRDLGVELVPGDLKDRASLDAACRGVSAVVACATTTLSRQPGDSIAAVDGRGQLQLVDAACVAGVARYVFVSLSGNIDEDSPLVRAKRAVERHLQKSGLPYAILRPSYFMEVWLGPALGFDLAKARVRIFGSGERPVSWVSLPDVATFAVQALDNPAAHSAVLELGGPEAVSPNEVVRRAERLGGRPIQVERVPEEALRQQLATATDEFQQAFTALMLDVAQGDAIDMAETRRAFPVPLTSVDDYLRRVVPAASGG